MVIQSRRRRSRSKTKRRISKRGSRRISKRGSRRISKRRSRQSSKRRSRQSSKRRSRRISKRRSRQSSKRRSRRISKRRSRRSSKRRSRRSSRLTSRVRGGTKGKKKSVKTKRKLVEPKVSSLKRLREPVEAKVSPLKRKLVEPKVSPLKKQKSQCKLASPGKGCRESIVCFRKFFKDRKQIYDVHLTETAEFLATLGLPCAHLLTVNFSTNDPFNRSRSERNNSQILRAYARDVHDLSSGLRSDDYVYALAVQTAMALLHEAYYSILSKLPIGQGKPAKNLGIDEGFAKSQALEVIALHYVQVCPECRGKLALEHLQHRGDLYCTTPGCMVDIDVKTSLTNDKPRKKGTAMGHCLEYGSSDPNVRAKARKTRYSTYLQDIDSWDFSICMIDCATLNKQTGNVTSLDCTGPIPYDLYYRLAKMGIAIVKPYLDAIRKLDERM
jgi:hypothetical protein